jgi:histidinol-phosphate aminotransferase
VRTMSKAFAFAGARVGYLVARPEVINAMLLVRLPYHLSALTQSAALAAIELSDQLLANVQRIIDSRKKLQTQLVSLGLSVLPSDSNFLLFNGLKKDSALVWQSLVNQGILIRDVGIPNYLRVTVGTESENESFVAALARSLNE